MTLNFQFSEFQSKENNSDNNIYDLKANNDVNCLQIDRNFIILKTLKRIFNFSVITNL